jgi:ABC-type transport system involved in multi-copper enzyme maturation permease subunit
MIERLWTVYTFELSKAFRLKSTYAGPLLVLATVLLTPLLHPFGRDNASDYDFVAVATQTSVNLVGVYLVLIYSSSLIATEISRGTARMVLVRPVLRRDFFLAKLLLGMTYAVLLSAVAAGASWTVAGLFGDLSGVRYGGEVIYTNTALSRTYVGVLGLGLLAQFAAVAFGLMMSALSRSAGAAVGATVGLWLVVNLVKHPLGIAPLLFSTYIEAPWTVFTHRAVALEASWTPMVFYAVATSVVSIAVFVAMGMGALSRRNLRV